MKKLNLYLLALLFAPLFFVFTSCGDGSQGDQKGEDSTEQTAEVNETQVLLEYLETSDFLNKPKSEGGAPTMIKAKKVKEMVDAHGPIYVLDLRAAVDFANGHIPGAVNVPMSELYGHMKNEVDKAKYEKIVFVCYSGQSASYATSVFRLLGYDNTFAMKWGMSAWNKKFAKTWENRISNDFAEKLETEANPKAAEGELPVIKTGKTTGEEILDERAKKVLQLGFKPVKLTAEELFENPGNYYVMNYWPEEKYNFGHVPGAIQYPPKKSFKSDAFLKTLPTDKEVVTYCYTGQHSAFVTAYLNILGYKAKSLLFGANSLINSTLVEKDWHGFSNKVVHDYEFETSEVPADAEQTEEVGGC